MDPVLLYNRFIAAVTAKYPDAGGDPRVGISEIQAILEAAGGDEQKAFDALMLWADLWKGQLYYAFVSNKDGGISVRGYLLQLAEGVSPEEALKNLQNRAKPIDQYKDPTNDPTKLLPRAVLGIDRSGNQTYTDPAELTDRFDYISEVQAKHPNANPTVVKVLVLTGVVHRGVFDGSKMNFGDERFLTAKDEAALLKLLKGNAA